MPSSVNRFWMSGLFTTFATSAESLSMMGCGVPAGARNSTHVEPSIGGPPALLLAAASKVPYGVDEYGLAGALNGAPIDVTPAETREVRWCSLEECEQMLRFEDAREMVRRTAKVDHADA